MLLNSKVDSISIASFLAPRQVYQQGCPAVILLHRPSFLATSNTSPSRSSKNSTSRAPPLLIAIPLPKRRFLSLPQNPRRLPRVPHPPPLFHFLFLTSRAGRARSFSTKTSPRLPPAEILSQRKSPPCGAVLAGRNWAPQPP